MCSLPQTDGGAGKKMDGTALLYVTAILDDDLTPIAANRGKRAYIHVFSDDDIAGDGSLWVYKGRGIDRRPVSVKFVEHN
jgi:hypothetical protein